MSPPLGHIILTPNQLVVTTYKYDARLAEKQRLPILKSSRIEPTTSRTRGERATSRLPRRLPIKKLLLPV